MGHAASGQGCSLATDSAFDDLPTHTNVHAPELEHLLRDGLLRMAPPPPRRGEYPGETPIEGAGAVARWVALHDRARALRAALRRGDGVGACQVQRAIRSLFLYEHQLTSRTRRQARTTLWRRECADGLPAFAERARWSRCRCTGCQPILQTPAPATTCVVRQAAAVLRSA